MCSVSYAAQKKGRKGKEERAEIWEEVQKERKRKERTNKCLEVKRTHFAWNFHLKMF